MINGMGITYTYDANGTKLKLEYDGMEYDYLDGFHYQDEALQFIITAEGYYDMPRKRYVYNYVDHLGNIRVSYAKNAGGTAEILTENNYYPFGMTHQNYNNVNKGNVTYNYKFNGKEWQSEWIDSGSKTYDFGARMYDPATGRWGVIDPLAEMYPSMSPYVYTFNNPVRFVDPTGMAPDDWVEDKKGNITWREDVTKDNYKDKGVLAEGEVYRGTYYERVKEWQNVKDGNGNMVNNVVLEMYHTYKKMSYSEMESSNISIDGNMRNNKLADVSVSVDLTFQNGKTKNWNTYDAVAGGYGNGAPENGNYTIDYYRSRGKTGSESGYYKDGVSFTYNLNPMFSTGRTDLRVHPDGNNEGTLGCVGLSGNGKILREFRDRLNAILRHTTSIPTSINIIGNPNNNGRTNKNKQTKTACICE